MRFVEFNNASGSPIRIEASRVEAITAAGDFGKGELCELQLASGEQTVVRGTLDDVQAKLQAPAPAAATPIEIPQDIADTLRGEGLRLARLRLATFFRERNSAAERNLLLELDARLGATLAEVRAGAWDPDELPATT